MILNKPFGALLSAMGVAMLILVPFVASAQDVADKVAPEFASGISEKEMVTTGKHMVVAANPYASKAGNDILKAGGNAIDAMVAVQLVLGLVEPQSSGIGGGAFLVYFDADEQKVTTIDGRETAPANATPDMFLDDAGLPRKFFEAVIGGLSVGTPGTVKLLHDAHTKYGKLDWPILFEPAIRLAREGFIVSPRLNAMIAASAESLYVYPATREYFLSEEGVPLFVGTRIINEAYAETLEAIARDGPAAFYKGAIAQDIVDTVQNAEGNPGLLSLDDLAGYTTREREPVCAAYRGYDVCGMGPPSSGALTVGQILKLVEPHDLAGKGPLSADSWRVIGDASRLAFADRGKYMADSDFVKMPKGLLNADYMSERSKLLERPTALSKDEVVAGEPPTDHAVLFGLDDSPELPSTSHFSIADADGNVVSMTTTIENGFGSRLMVRGFLLNNELTDFSFRPERDGLPVANRVEPGKRPRSSMSPTIVMKDGKPYMAIGSPGGSRIIGYVAKTLIAHIDWGLNVQEAISLPHLVNRFGTYDLEEGTAAESFQPALEAMGFETNVRSLNSGLHGIVFGENLQGGADPRREGIVTGE